MNQFSNHFIFLIICFSLLNIINLILFLIFWKSIYLFYWIDGIFTSLFGIIIWEYYKNRQILYTFYDSTLSETDHDSNDIYYTNDMDHLNIDDDDIDLESIHLSPQRQKRINPFTQNSSLLVFDRMNKYNTYV